MAKPRVNWATVDWALPTTKIAKLLNYDLAYVSRQRAKYAPETTRRTKKKTFIDWNRVDWSLSAEEIAAKYGVHLLTVRKNRRQRRPDLIHTKPDAAIWGQVDWRRPTSVIARELGVAGPAVDYRRRQYAPETVGKYKAHQQFKPNVLTRYYVDPVKLTMIRKRKKYSQSQVQRALDLSRNALNNYETGRRQPSADILARLLLFYRARIEDVVSEKRES